MRTALVLLFLLAIAAVPGSVFPQRGANPLAVDDYFEQHPTLAPILDRLSAFDVFASPWFAAVYLLLFLSLIGCLVPRIRHHVGEVRREPPRTPRRLDRLPANVAWRVPRGADAPTLAESAARRLRTRRWRAVVREESDGSGPGAWTVAAEKGYLRETGNLTFHLSLLVLLVGLGWGAFGGWRGTMLVQEGETACASPGQFDQFSAGAGVTAADIPPLCLTLEDFRAEYLPNGQPTDFEADITYTLEDPSAQGESFTLAVNNPLRLDGTRVYLLNHGFSPVVTVTDPSGAVFERIRAPFLPQDPRYTSEGVFKLPDARPQQYGFEGFFLPTKPESGPPIQSVSPMPVRPGLTLLAYAGDLGLDSGRPQSVYSLDADQISSGALEKLESASLEPGETWTLPDGGTLRFDGYDEWATLQVTEDPGQLLALGAAAAMVAGVILSLGVRRRRMWLRVRPDGAGGANVVEAGGLARSDPDRFTREFEDLTRDLTGFLAEDRAGVPAGPETDEHEGTGIRS